MNNGSITIHNENADIDTKDAHNQDLNISQVHNQRQKKMGKGKDFNSNPTRNLTENCSRFEESFEAVQKKKNIFELSIMKNLMTKDNSTRKINISKLNPQSDLGDEKSDN